MISLTKHNELKGYKSLDAYPEVAHFVTTRHGGISTGAYGSFNCSPYTNDSCMNVNRNQSQSELVVSVHESSDKGIIYS